MDRIGEAAKTGQRDLEREWTILGELGLWRVVVEDLWQILAKLAEGQGRVRRAPAEKAESDLLDPGLAEKRNRICAGQDAVRREQADNRARRGAADRVDRGVDVFGAQMAPAGDERRGRARLEGAELLAR